MSRHAKNDQTKQHRNRAVTIRKGSHRLLNAAIPIMEVLEQRQLLTAVMVSADPTVLRSDTPQPAMPGHTFYIQGTASQWDQSSSVTPYITNDLLLNTSPTDTDYAACCEANTADNFGMGAMPNVLNLTNGTTQSIADSTNTVGLSVGELSKTASDPSSATNVLAQTGNGDTKNNGGMPLWHATYTLGSQSGNTPNATGYDISEIDVIAGHQDYRTGMSIDVEVSTDGTTFTSLSGGNDFVFETDGSGVGLGKGGSQMAIVSGTAGQPIATGIKAIRFDNIQAPGLGNNGTWFRELVITGTATGVANPTPPTAPGTPTVSSAGVVSFMDNSTNETGFDIQRGTSATGPWATIGLLGPNPGTGMLSLTDHGPYAAGAVFYRVVAHSDGLGDSASGAAMAPAAIPGKVTGLSGIRNNSTTNTLTWSGVFGATSYDVKRGTALNPDGTLGGTITDLTASGIAATSFTDTNAPAPTLFYYQVTASSSAGAGPGSNVVGVGGGEGFIGSFYASDTAGNYPFDGDSVSTQVQPTPDGRSNEGANPSGTAVLGYQEIFFHPVNANGNDGIPPTDAPPDFNLVQGAGNRGHQFAARFSGIFTPLITGYYTLGPSTDDGGAITWGNVDANGVPSSPVTLVPVGSTTDNLTALRGNTLDVCPVVDSTGKAVQWIAGNHYYIQMDMNNNGGGWDYHLYDAISSTAANQGSQMFDTQGQALISPGDVNPPVPTFNTIDAANPAGLAKDNPFYAGSAASGNAAVELDWNNIAADSYNIYRATSMGGPFTKINAAPIAAKAGTLIYDDTGLTNGTTYFYIITGVDIAGETAQANGIHLSATPMAAPPHAPVANSATPGSISNEATPITALTYNVTVTWNRVPLADSYNVLRGTTKGGPYTQLASGITGLSYTDPTASANTTYYYVVQAVNAVGASGNSNELTLVLPPAGLPAVADSVTEHFYDNRYWGSPNQSTTGYQTPDLLGHSVTAPYVDTNGSKTIDLHGTDAATDPLPPNGDIKDNFSVIFTGQLRVVSGGSYTFHANTDDDGYLVVDGQIVANDGGAHGAQEGTAFPITLASNTTYDFQFYEANGGGGWDWHMEWMGPDSPTEAIVPIATSPTTSGIVNSAEDVPANPTPGALAVNGKNVTVTWTDNAVSELEYVLQRSTDPTFATNDTTMILPFVENKGGAVAQGSFTDKGLANGTYYYRLQAVNFDGVSAILNLGAATVGGGAQPDTITGTAGNDAITLKQDADGTDIDWTLNGGAVNKVAINDPNGLTINGNGGTDTITLDNSNGDPTPKLLVLNQTGSGSEFILIGLNLPSSAGHKMDIENSTVQINYSGSSILPAVQSALSGGQIFSSTLASNPKFAIADDDSADPLNSGQAANTILLRPAIIGNATLNGKVGFGDLVQLARNYGKSNADWAMGDFNYDGKVGFDDLVPLARNYNQSGPATTAAALTPTVSADTGTLPKSRRPLSTRLG